MSDEGKRSKRSKYMKEYRASRPDETAKYAKEYKAIKSQERKKNVKYVTIAGKLKKVNYPDNIIEKLSEKLEVDPLSETGLRWRNSYPNKFSIRGNEAGKIRAGGYFYIRIIIDSIQYSIQSANVVWMLVNKRIVEDGKIIDHYDHNRRNNKIENLISRSMNENVANRSKYGKLKYKNLYASSRIPRSGKIKYGAGFRWKGVTWYAKMATTQDHAFVLGWELMTSGSLPLEYIKAQPKELLDGTEIRKALAECAKHGIAVTPPKFKTLYEYIASVEGSC